jgi:hypothetical protein
MRSKPSSAIELLTITGGTRLTCQRQPLTCADCGISVGTLRAHWKNANTLAEHIWNTAEYYFPFRKHSTRLIGHRGAIIGVMKVLSCVLAAFALLLSPDASYAQACELIVNQPSGTPLVNRVGPNDAGATVTLRIASHPAYGSWNVHLTALLYFRPLGSSGFSLVSQNTQQTFVPAGAAVGTLITASEGASLEPRGDGEYRVNLSAFGYCNTVQYPLTPTNPVASTLLSVRRPTITANGIAGMWWLGGVSDPPAGLYDSAQIVGTTNCASCSSPLAYSIAAGADKSALTCSSCNTTNARAVGPNASPYCNAQDVVVQANLGGFSAAAPVRLTVNTYYGPTRVTPKPPTSTTSAFNGGWRTTILYNLRDLCGPATIPMSVNEQFGTRTPSSSQWLLPTPTPGFVIPVGDEIAVWPTQPGSLQPTTPNSPLGSTLVDQYPWNVRVGSQTSGSGLLVITTDTLRYVDHGDHSFNP